MFNSGGFEVQRFRYWQGQKLRSVDFRDQLSVEAQLRWWHNRALHSSFGVRRGFSVTEPADAAHLKQSRGESNESNRRVIVGCGLAYDCYGRELLLQTAKELPLPAIGSQPIARATLVVRYKPTARSGASNSMCASTIEEPDFAWITEARLELTDGVPIARLSYESESTLDVLPAEAKFSGEVAERIRCDAGNKRLIFAGVM